MEISIWMFIQGHMCNFFGWDRIAEDQDYESFGFYAANCTRGSLEEFKSLLTGCLDL